MKAKKYVLAIAIFGGMLFAAQASNLIDLNGQTKTEIHKGDIQLPGQGKK